jgi:hypothetical protein
MCYIPTYLIVFPGKCINNLSHIMETSATTLGVHYYYKMFHSVMLSQLQVNEQEMKTSQWNDTLWKT